MSAAPHARKLMEPLRPVPVGIEPKLASLTGIKAVVFDIYGTLLISAAGEISLDEDLRSREAMEAAISALPRSPRESNPDAWNEFYREGLAILRQQRKREVEFPEVDIRDVWKEVLRRAGCEISDFEYLETVARIFEYRINPCWEMPGARDVVDELRSRGYSLGLISNAQFYTHALVEELVGVTTGAPCFVPDLTVFSYQIGEGKPSPQLFRIVQERAEALGLRPGEILYIGNDYGKDIAPAALSGFRTGLFAGDRRSFRPGPEGSEYACRNADLVLTNLSQVADVVEKEAR